jgi:hypothetical protein
MMGDPYEEADDQQRANDAKVLAPGLRRRAARSWLRGWCWPA